MEELQAALTAHFAGLNSSADATMDNLSPLDMDQLIHYPFEENCPLAFRNDLNSETVLQMPFMNLMRGFLLQAAEPKGIRLTKGGNLNVKLVKSLYGRRLLVNEYIEAGSYNLNKEQDSVWIQNLRQLAMLSGLAKAEKEQLTLTAKGRKLVEKEDWPTIFKWVFLTQLRKFNMGYHDGFPETDLQLLSPFALYLMCRYGEESRPLTFYIEKFNQAFPTLLPQVGADYGAPIDLLATMLEVRLYTRFLNYYGMTTVANPKKIGFRNTEDAVITVTKLFAAAIELRPERFVFTRPKHTA